MGSGCGWLGFGKHCVWVNVTTLLGLGDLHRHGYNNKLAVTIRERSWSWFKRNQHWLAVGNGKMNSAVLCSESWLHVLDGKSKVLLTRASTPSTSVRGLYPSIITSPHRTVSICQHRGLVNQCILPTWNCIQHIPFQSQIRNACNVLTIPHYNLHYHSNFDFSIQCMKPTLWALQSFVVFYSVVVCVFTLQLIYL